MLEKLLEISNRIMKTIRVLYYRQHFKKRAGEKIVEGFHPLRQTMSYTCGTVAMISAGVELSKKSISELMDMDSGITIFMVKRYMKRHGTKFIEIKSRMSPARIKRAIDDGYVLVTTTNQSGGHWVVVFGYYRNGILMGGCNTGIRYTWREFQDEEIDGCSDGTLLVKI